ncbi:MAG: alanine/glycine:cation symporter family protein [Caulobacteraceae bacterium]
MSSFSDFLNWLSGILWGPYMIALLVGTGIFLTFKLGFIQIRFFKMAFKETFTKIFKPAEGEGEIKSFQALAAALSACVGVGNIAGVATAIALGGPGAIFWMWVSALFGMATKYSEITLSMKYREKDENGVWRGGPMYVLKNALKWKGAAVFFAAVTAFVGLISCDMVQSNSVASALTSYNIPPYVTGLVLGILTFLVIFGGVKRLGKVTSFITPFMGLFYIIGALVVVVINYNKVIPAFALIITDAFTGQAALGGFAGAGIQQAMRFGVARGIFSNEAGIGSSPMIHATATVDHPCRQGLYGIMEVFIDTIVICTMTALVIITTGAWQTGLTSAALSNKAFEIGLSGGWGTMIVTIAIALFAYSTLLSWSWYGETAIEFIFGKAAITPYRVLWVICVFIGAVSQLDLIWLMADTVNGFMAIPNLISLLLLSGTIAGLTKEFADKAKQ